MLSLAAPLWLLALPLPWLLWRWLRLRPPRRKAMIAALRHPQMELLEQLGQSGTSRRRTPWLWLLGCTLVLLALARPQTPDPATLPGRNILLALDTSGSMRAMDFSIDGQAVSRLDMVKRVVSDFLARRARDRIGLIIFGDEAMTLAPLSTDHALLRTLLGEVHHDMAGERTAIGTAIALGIKRLQQTDVRSRILVLLTDGTNTAGEITPNAALHLALSQQVKIYTIGIGSHGKVVFPRGPNQAPDYKEVPLDETLLQHLAGSSGGRYYRATNTDELTRIIADIDALETVPLRHGETLQQEWYWPPLMLGLLVLLLAQWRAQRSVAP